jgi:CubicO group peptidase (beta-lactamase class C family)
VGTHLNQAWVEKTVAEAAQRPLIHALVVAHGGRPVVERGFRGQSLDHPVDIGSVSKAVMTSLVGIAIDKGLIDSVDQPILPLLQRRAPANLDPRVATITIRHLLSMRSGLEQTSGWRYETRWAESPDWVAYALSRPFIDQPGGRMIYSSGNTHLLSAILTNLSGKSTWELAASWLGEPLGVMIPPWSRDPHGIFVGGRELLISPRGLLRFGELYRNAGLHDGHQVLSRDWVEASWTPHATGTTGRAGYVYGYGWFIGEAYGHPVYDIWGRGGQLLSVIPSLELTIVVISDPTPQAVLARNARNVQELVVGGLMPAAMQTV